MKYAWFSKRDPRICPCVKETFTSPQQQNCDTLKEENTWKGLGELAKKQAECRLCKNRRAYERVS